MTTTTNQIGIAGDERLSSRVLRPPGGASNFTLGFASDEPSPPPAASSNQTAGGSQSSSPATSVAVSNAQEPTQSSTPPVAVVAPVQPYRQDSHSRLFGGGDTSGTDKGILSQRTNPITGEGYAEHTSIKRINRGKICNPITGDGYNVNASCTYKRGPIPRKKPVYIGGDGANPITGGDAIISGTGAAAMRNTSRVLQPPGGQSNITF